MREIMDEEMKGRLTRRSVWVRAIFMVLFAIAFGIAEILVWAVVVIQFLVVLFTGRANEQLLQFGNNLSAYVYRLLRFQTFNTEAQPFPFSDWPDEPVTDNPWTHDPDAPEDPPDEENGEAKNGGS